MLCKYDSTNDNDSSPSYLLSLRKGLDNYILDNIEEGSVHPEIKLDCHITFLIKEVATSTDGSHQVPSSTCLLFMDGIKFQVKMTASTRPRNIASIVTAYCSVEELFCILSVLLV